MAFEIVYRGRSGQRLSAAIRRRSDGACWTPNFGWTRSTLYIALTETSRGCYSRWFTATQEGEVYDVVILTNSRDETVLGNYAYDSHGKPATRAKIGTKITGMTMIGGILHVDGKPQKAMLVLEAMASNGVSKYTAIRWHPSGIASCNCPGWAWSRENKGKALAERSCKHTQQLPGMAVSISSPGPPAQGPTLPPASSAVGERTGRGVELD